MESLYLFNLASHKATWLTTRQSLISANIANANTPKYIARDLTPFSKILDNTDLPLATTNPSHVDMPFSEQAASLHTKASEAWDITHSGNSVSLEQEMLKLANIKDQYSLDLNIVRSFHRFWLAASKGGAA